MHLRLRGWEARPIDSPGFIWTGSSSLCHSEKPLRAGNTTKGGNRAIGNGGYPGTD